MRPIALITLLGLSACTLGPDYVPATPAAPDRFARAMPEVAPAPPLERWWLALNDDVLNALEEQALASNPGLAQASARIGQARAALRLERADRAPKASPSATYLHGQLPDTSGGGNLDFYDLGFDASWEADLFGGGRRKVEVARAALDGAQASLADAQVSLTAEVALAYVNLRDRQTRLALAQDAAKAQDRIVDLTLARVQAGTATQLDLERARGQAETAQSQIAGLAAERDTFLDALAVLAARPPGALDDLLQPMRPTPRPPATVEIGDPAALLQRRPDVRKAERQLAADTARIGVAQAARFPKLSVMGVIGLGGSHVEDIVDPSALSVLAAPRLTWDLLDFGRSAARVEQARGKRDEAQAAYDQAVLRALQDAEDALTRYGARRASLSRLIAASRSADRAVALMRQRQAAGTARMSDVLEAERQAAEAAQRMSSGLSGLTADFVSLQKALGLGWRPADRSPA